MQSRTSHSQVTFRRPFRLAGMDTWAPAGRHKVALEEEQLDSLTVEAWRQIFVTLQIASAGTTDYLNVDPGICVMPCCATAMTVSTPPRRYRERGSVKS